MLAFGKAECEQNVIAFDIACLLQALTKCAQTLRERCSSAKKPNHRHRRLLRPRRKRPRNRHAADERNELTPSLIELHSVPSQGRIAEYRINEGQSGDCRIRTMSYEECIGAKKHLVTGVSAHTGPLGSNSFSI